MNWYSVTKKSAIVSFDFDDTLTIPVYDEEEERWITSLIPQSNVIDKVFEHDAIGDTIVITTFRHSSGENKRAIQKFITENGLPIDFENIRFTGSLDKSEFLARVDLHYDDDLTVYDDVVKNKNRTKIEMVRHPHDVEYGDYDKEEYKDLGLNGLGLG
jgi:hypothetical protein